MEAFYSIVIDKKSQTPLYQQLAQGLCRLIEEGVLPANSKLPPIRRMAAQLHINTVTVVTAYKYLEQKKVVYSLVGSGTYVSALSSEQLQRHMTFPKQKQWQRDTAIKDAVNFADTSMPQTLFPIEQFKEAFDAVLDKEGGNAFCHLDSMGYFPLRQILCQYLKQYKIQANEEAIQIISGAQQGIDIIAKALLNYGDVIFTERPTFYGACGSFLYRGGNIISIDMEQDGMNMAELEDFLKLYRPKFLYMMAYFQTPTGISYSMEKKRRLLELAEKYHFYIIEDDNLYDFYYAKETIVPLKALDYKNRVIYIKSFSKIWTPGLRMGFMLFPKKFLESIQRAKYTTDIATSGFLQKGVAYYLQKYGWQTHSRIMRQYGKEQYHMAVSAAKKHLQQKASFFLPEGGISLWVTLPEPLKAEDLCQEALKKGVIVAPASQYYIGECEKEAIRICFCNVTQMQMEKGMKAIGECIDKLLKNSP